jgi:hypothetical protein
LQEFASSSDLGILSAALLGPLIYTIFKEYTPPSEVTGLSRFPSGLWFIILIIIACVIATTIYCFVYVSKSQAFFNKAGSPIWFVNSGSVELLSWILLILSVFLVTAATTIRNSMETRARAAAQQFSEETENFVSEFRHEQETASTPTAPADMNAGAEAIAQELAHPHSDQNGDQT